MHIIARFSLFLLMSMMLLTTACKERDPIRDAERAIGQGLPDKAVPILNKKLREEPGNEKARRLLVQAYVNMGEEKFSEAEKQIQTLLSKKPKDEKLSRQLGEVIFNQIKLEHSGGGYEANKERYEYRMVRALKLAHPALRQEVVQYLAGFYDEYFEEVSASPEHVEAVPRTKFLFYAKSDCLEGRKAKCQAYVEEQCRHAEAGEALGIKHCRQMKRLVLAATGVEAPEDLDDIPLPDPKLYLEESILPPTEPLIATEFSSRINSAIRKIAREEKEKVKERRLQGYKDRLEAVGATKVEEIIGLLNKEVVERNVAITQKFKEKFPQPTDEQGLLLLTNLKSSFEPTQLVFEANRVVFQYRHNFPLNEENVKNYYTANSDPNAAPEIKESGAVVRDLIVSVDRLVRGVSEGEQRVRGLSPKLLSLIVPRMLEGIDEMKIDFKPEAIQTLLLEKVEFVDYKPPAGMSFPTPAKQIMVTASITKEEIISLAIDYELAHKQGLFVDDDAEKKRAEDLKKKKEGTPAPEDGKKPDGEKPEGPAPTPAPQ